MNTTTNSLDRVEQLALRAFCNVLNDLLEQKPLKSTERWTIEDSGVQVTFFSFTPTSDRSQALVQLSSPIAQDSTLSHINWVLCDKQGHVLQNGRIRSSGQIQLGVLDAHREYSLYFVIPKHATSDQTTDLATVTLVSDWLVFDAVIAADTESSDPRITIFEESPIAMKIEIERVRPDIADFGVIGVAIVSQLTGEYVKKWLLPVDGKDGHYYASVPIDEISSDELENGKWRYTIDSRQLIESTSKQEVLDLIESSPFRFSGNSESKAKINRLLSLL